MSLLLLQEGQMDQIILHKYLLGKESNVQQKHAEITQKESENRTRLSRMKLQVLCQFKQQTETSQTWVLFLGNILAKYKSILKIKFHKKVRSLQLTLCILNLQETYFKVANTRALPQLSLKVSRFSQAVGLQMTKAAYNMVNGMFSLQLPIYYLSDECETLIGQRGQIKIEYLYKNYLQNLSPLLEFIINSCSTESAINRFDHPSKVKTRCNIQRYAQMLNVSSHISQASITEQEASERSGARRADILRLIKNKIKVDDAFTKINEIFQYRPRTSLGESDYQISQDELFKIQSMIAMPIIPKPKLPRENTMNFNFIYIYDIYNLKLTRVNEGGFSSIFLSSIKYICVYPTEGYDIYRPTSSELSNAKNIIEKYVIIKKEDEDVTFSRNRHQIEILKKLRNSSSVFLPKYYVFVNKPNPYCDSVVMDFIPYSNLKDYLRDNYRSISTYTKIYLLLSITQALRFVRDHRIVHLDLKPNNIMIFTNLVIKLIDFGESYHPQVCSKWHKPGFTIPYSSPEIFSNESKYFTTKSDVFSLGVIMFEMLYNAFPFDIFEPTEMIDDVMQGYLKKWFFAAEEFQTFGDINILRTLNDIISKCLSPDPRCRPELDWMAIVLRNCLQLLR